MRCKTKHLDVLAEGGPIWVQYLEEVDLFDYVSCGRIFPCRTSFLWPSALGEEPDWFAAECEDLAAQVTTHYLESRRLAGEYHRQVLADYDALCVGRPA